MTNHLYEVAHRDGNRVCVAHTLATSAADAMDQFLDAVRATKVGSGEHHDDCRCLECNRAAR